MQTARTASIAFLALIFPVAALVFPIGTRAASGNVQVCQPSSSCQVGEFLYDDSYAPITSATCTITSRYPDGTVLLNGSAMTASSQNDGWYYKDVATPSTTGIYRTQVCCTSGSDYLCLDKTFEVKNEATTDNVAGAVWNASKSSYTTSGTFGSALQNSVPSASDVASATWGYSERSLSTFGTLIRDFWIYTERTLTDSDTTTNINTTVNNISGELTETNNMIEQILKKPTIESSIENGEDSTTLETKIDNTQKYADTLTAKLKYIKGKVSLIDSNWTKINSTQVSKSLNDVSLALGSSKDVTNKSSVLGASVWIGEQWKWQEAESVTSQSNALKNKVSALQNEIEKKGKTEKVKKDLKALSVSIDKINNLVGSSLSSSKQKSVYNRLTQIREIAKGYDSKTQELTKIYSSLDKSELKLAQSQTDQISKDLVKVNFIPKISKNILAKAEIGDKGMKNKVLSLIGIIDANKKFLAKKPEDTLASTWLELGSIVFKTLVTNPSEKISQEVPVKYYLPKEIKRENILEIDSSLSVEFDPEKDQYFAKGNFELKAGETKTLSIKVDDSVFALNEDELNGLKKQADELSAPLKNTSYFAQGATLKTDIDASVNKILSLQQSANTPEEKIRAYREGQILLASTNEKMDKLKEIATSAGSVNTMFGFVGGAQVLAVWGLVIILVAGFVSLALYLRMIKRSENKTVESKITNKKTKRASFDEEYEATEKVHRGHKGFRLAAFVVVGVVSVGLSLGLLMNFRGKQAQTKEETKSEVKLAENTLGEATASATLNETQGEEINLIVPEDALANVHKDASIDSDILYSFEYSQKVEKIASQDGWVEIIYNKNPQEKAKGFVDSDFIEGTIKEITEAIKVDNPERQEKNQSIKLVTISDTPTGFLRFRASPGGKELGKLDPGKKFPVLDSKSGWLNILLDDGTSGWVSGKYTDFANAKATGGQIAP